jgi:hypothetical protein
MIVFIAGTLFGILIVAICGFIADAEPLIIFLGGIPVTKVEETLYAASNESIMWDRKLEQNPGDPYYSGQQKGTRSAVRLLKELLDSP